MEIQEDAVSQRLKCLIEQFEDGVQRRFALRLGVNPTMISEIFGKRKNKPSVELLQKTMETYPQLRTDWLLLGEGQMLKSDANADTAQKTLPYTEPENRLKVIREEKQAPYQAAGSGLRVLTVQVGADNEENIEFVDTRAAAGYGAGGFLQQEFIGQLPHFRLPDPAYRNGSFRCFQVSGESMQSTLYNGDWVICRYIERWDRDIRDNRVYVIVTDEGVRIKRLLNRLTERGNLALQSDNPAFPVDFLGGAEVREVWEAVGRLSRQFVNPRYDVTLELSRTRADVDELLAFMLEMKGQQQSTNTATKSKK